MKTLNKNKSLILLFLTTSALFSSSVLIKTQLTKPIFHVLKEETEYTPKAEFVKFVNFGQKMLFSSLTWVWTLIESDHNHYENDDLNSWMYRRFSFISEIDPNFYENYRYGSQYLSIVKDDIYGAQDILNRGLKIYSEDFWLNFLSGFNNYYELGKPKEALFHFKKIQYHPTTQRTFHYLPSIVAKLEAKTNSLEAAYDMLTIAYERAGSKDLKQRYYDSLYGIKAELDLKCLNANNEGCNRLDLDGNAYIFNKSKGFQAQKEWKEFKLYK